MPLQAIERLGGANLYKECLTLKHKLEKSGERIICEIFNEMQISKKEIEDIKEEMLRLKEKHSLEVDLARAEQQEEAELERLHIRKDEISKRF